jgi:phosphohistidine phosphatase
MAVSSPSGRRRLTLVRHGHAEDKEPAHRDFDRALDRRGRAEVAEMARRCLELGLLPDLLVTSAAVRAVQTAAAFERLLESPAPPLQVEPGLYLAEAGTLLDFIRGTDDGVDHLMLVAHNPGLGDLAQQLAPGARFSGFETAATCSMQFTADSWRGVGAGRAEQVRYDTPGRFFDLWS